MPRLLLALAAFLVSLAAAELGARLFLPPSLGDRVEISDAESSTQADCYPRARGVRMMYDLARRDDLMAFVHRFKLTRIAWPGDPSRKSLQTAPPPETYEHAIARLRAEAPLCMVYDTGDASPRFLSAPPGFRHTLALLGDSFTFGQGVRDEESLAAQLAALSGWRVRSYARPGANIPEIEEEFERAMKDRGRLGLERIVYLYVPNDPEMTSEITDRLNLLNDLMNQRIGATPYSSRPEVRLLGRVAVHSALAAAVLRAYSSRVVAAKTLRFYEDANDPARNSGFVDTFRRIRGMRDRAAAAGVDFALVAYPLMLDFRRYPLRSIHRHLKDAAGDIPFLDLLPAFERASGDALVVHPIDYHPNAKAARIAAGAITGFLASFRGGERGLGEGGRVVPHVSGPRAR